MSQRAGKREEEVAAATHLLSVSQTLFFETGSEWQLKEKKSASVTHFRDDGIMRSGQELQTCGSDFPLRYKHNVTTGSNHLFPSGMRRLPMSLLPFPPPPSRTHLSQHMAYCLLARRHRRDIGLAPCSRISYSHPWCPPYLPTPIRHPPSLQTRSSPPTSWGYVTELRSWAVLSWHK